MAQYIHSVEQLEILACLAESPDKSWSKSEVFKVIQSSHESVASNLRHFAHHGFLLESDGTFCFSTKNPELSHIALELIRTYRQRRVAVIEALYLMPPDAIRQFADAFKLRKNNR